MANYPIQFRRGTTAEHAGFTGLEGELSIDTDKYCLVVHDGSTPGGQPMAKDDLSNLSSAATARSNLGLGTAATGDTGTNEGNIVVLGPGGTLPAGISASDDLSRTNIGYIMMRLGIIEGIAAGEMAGGFFSSLQTIADIDPAESSGYVYDSTNKYMSNMTGDGSTEKDTVNSTGGQASGYLYGTRNFLINNSSYVKGFFVTGATAFTGYGYILKRTGAGEYTVVESKAFSHTGGGEEEFDFDSPVPIPASGDYCVAIQATSNPGSISSTAAVSRFYKNVGTGELSGDLTSVSEDTSYAPVLGVRYAVAAAMTLVWDAVSAASQPETGKCGAWVEYSGSPTVGLSVSRDDGTTYENGSVSVDINVGSNQYILSADGIDLSAQPAGTTMRMKLTVDAVQIIVRGINTQWI